MPLVLLALGGFLLIVAAVLAWSSWSWSREAIATEGTVIRLERMPMPNGAGPVKPVIEFKTSVGNTIEFDGRDAANEAAAMPVGSRVAVLYDPRQPTSAIVDEFASRWLFPAFFAGAGGCIALIGMLILAVQRLITARRGKPARADR